MLNSLYSLESLNPERSKNFKFGNSSKAYKAVSAEPGPSDGKDEEMDVDDYENE